MASSIEITPELLAGFLDEAPEYLDMLDAGLMELESQAGAGVLSLDAPEDQERMTTMFRAAHSLKGLAAAFGFDKIKELTHRMETLFDQVRMGKRDLTSDSFETLFHVFDRLKALLNELNDETAEPVDIADMLTALDGVLDAKASPPARPSAKNPTTTASEETAGAEAAAAPPSDSDAASSGGCDTQAANDALGLFDDPELVSVFLETTSEAIDELNQCLLGLEENPRNPELLNNVFRCAHNIKGASGAAGLSGMNRLTHEMETVFDGLRGGRLSLDVDLMNAVFKVVDRLRVVVDQLKAGVGDDVGPDELMELFKPWADGKEKTAAERSAPADTDADQKDTDSSREVADTPPAVFDASFDECVTVEVTFPKAFDEAVIQSYLIFNKLTDLGSGVTSDPDIESLAPDAELVKLTYRLVTDADPAELTKLLSAYHVDNIVVRPASSECDAEVAPRADAATCGDVPVAAAPCVRGVADAAGTTTTSGPSASTTAVASESPSARTPARVSASACATGNAGKSKNAPGGRHPVKTGETLRVDQERLDELMNLGGELVINRARFVQIHGKFREVFDGKNVNYLVDDLAEHLAQLGEGIKTLEVSNGQAHETTAIASHLRHLNDALNPIRALTQQVHALRGSMMDFDEALHGLTRVSEGIQRGIMGTRMVPVGPLFNRFRRVVRDITKANGKQVKLVLRGEHTELDKRMIDELGDPLTHMVRNSVDHGIESPDVRSAAGKDPVGTLTLSARHRGNSIWIEVIDDGAGINLERVRAKILERELATPAQLEKMSDREINQFVFKPGFSTAQKVTDVSGRGMGMDIVVNKIEKLSGAIELDSTPGQGTRVCIKLPLTLAILTSMVAKIGRGVYAIPLETVAEIITVRRADIQSIQRRQVVRVRDRVIPIAWFERIFASERPGLRTAARGRDDLTLAIIGFEEDKVGLVVDELLGQEDVVIKSLAENYRNVSGIAGASIRGDGTVSLILDVAAMMQMAAKRSGAAAPSEAVEAVGQLVGTGGGRR